MPRSETRLGIAMGVAAYTMWGVLPLFIYALRALPATAILAHRVLWSLLIMIALAFALRRWPAVRAAVSSPRILLALIASTSLIGCNWLLYIHAVNSGHTLEASLGYFINPLLNVLLGIVFLRERMGRVETVALLLAAAGVATLAIERGGLPVIPLGLAVTFGLYGLVRKMIGIGPIEGMLAETALLGPIGLGWLLMVPLPPIGADGAPPLWMLLACGIVTTAPLLLFTGAANRMRYSDLGLLQYIGPTLQLLIAVAVFGEAVSPNHILAFALIWTGLVVYAGATWRRERTRRPS